MESSVDIPITDSSPPVTDNSPPSARHWTIYYKSLIRFLLWIFLYVGIVQVVSSIILLFGSFLIMGGVSIGVGCITMLLFCLALNFDSYSVFCIIYFIQLAWSCFVWYNINNYNAYPILISMVFFSSSTIVIILPIMLLLNRLFCF